MLPPRQAKPTYLRFMLRQSPGGGHAPRPVPDLPKVKPVVRCPMPPLWGPPAHLRVLRWDGALPGLFECDNLQNDNERRNSRVSEVWRRGHLPKVSGREAEMANSITRFLGRNHRGSR